MTDVVEQAEATTTVADTSEHPSETIARLEAELEKSKEKIAQFRKYEARYKEQLSELGIKDAHKTQEQLQDEIKKREALETKVRDKAVNDALQSALQAAKAKSLSTVLKLVDKTQIKVTDLDSVDTASVEAVIKSLRESDPILFETEEQKAEAAPAIQHPPVKRATEGEVVGGFNVEMRKAKNAKEIESVLRKYNKLG